MREFCIKFETEAGVLDSVYLPMKGGEDEELGAGDFVEALARMLGSTPLHDGDTFTITIEGEEG